MRRRRGRVVDRSCGKKKAVSHRRRGDERLRETSAPRPTEAEGASPPQVTLASVAATAWVYIPNGFDNEAVIRYAVLARTLRLVRVLDAAPTFRRIGASLKRVLPAAARLFAALLWLALLFSGALVARFGGRITDDPASAYARAILRKAPDFATAADVGYYANSCNDVASCLVLLFELLIVNNWYALCVNRFSDASRRTAR